MRDSPRRSGVALIPGCPGPPSFAFDPPAARISRDQDALRDLEAVLAQVPRDVLSLSLRAKIRGHDGDDVGAWADLAATNAAVRAGTAYRSRLGDDDSDLEYLARGWAYCSVCLLACDGPGEGERERERDRWYLRDSHGGVFTVTTNHATGRRLCIRRDRFWLQRQFARPGRSVRSRCVAFSTVPSAPYAPHHASVHQD